MNKFVRRLFLGASIFGLTTFGSPVQAQNSRTGKAGGPTTEQMIGAYKGYSDTLYNVLLNRYSEYNKETAEKLARKSTDAYLKLLDDGKIAQADTLMMVLHENFEKKEVAAARKKAYTVKSTDSDKLKVLKKNTAAIYKNYLVSQKKFKSLDVQLTERRKADEEDFQKKVAARDSVAKAEGKNPKTLPPMKFEPSRERLELELRHANNMDELVDNEVELSKNDMILYKQQLKEDKKIVEADLKLIEQYQKHIDVINEQLKKLQLEKYAPDSLQGKRDHDRAVADDSQLTARTNLAKKDKKDKLEAMKKGWEAKQQEIFKKHEIKNTKDLEKKLAEIKADLKELRKNKEVEIKKFKMDEYKGSDQQKAAEGVKNDKGLGKEKAKAGNTKTKKSSKTTTATTTRGTTSNTTSTTTKTAQTNSTSKADPEILQEIKNVVRETKEEYELFSIKDPVETKFDNGVIQTRYLLAGNEETTILEYPSGKAAIIDATGTSIFEIDGHVREYVKGENGVVEILDGKEVEDSTVKTGVDVLQILNATGQMKSR